MTPEVMDGLLRHVREQFNSIANSLGFMRLEIVYMLDYVEDNISKFEEAAQRSSFNHAREDWMEAKREAAAVLKEDFDMMSKVTLLEEQKSVQGNAGDSASSAFLPRHEGGFLKSLKQRRAVVEEIVQTETNYLKLLEELESLYMTPLAEKLGDREEGGLLTKEENERIFGIMRTIINIVREHLPLMTAAVSSVTEGIGEVFLKLCPWLKHYAVYINSFDGSVKAIQTAKKRNPGFKKFLKDSEKKSAANYDLGSYLILPVQRLGRYELLLQTAFRETTRSHPDREDLITALEQVGDINAKINNIKRADENRQKVEELERNFVSPPSLFVPGRLLVREGKVMCARHKSMSSVQSKGKKPHVILLFDDLIVIAKVVKENRYEKKYSISLNDGVQIIEGGVGSSKGGRRMSGNLECLCLFRDKEGNMYYLLEFETSKEKEKWVSSFREVLSAVSVAKELSHK
eukprot:CAMPEP_0119118484 /NCGR_PEP_ID=MMETSP1310-20130426/347_1 /TAXON_ID=464262 /ORGANISM="Genus nov. species nov., Strain RCC2339" /LENGTH=459 /DNA_ID=CAMNT_0007107851 /DNA_START=279 /DNA_END=1658 /DNA_ORIENTATION=-